MKISSMLILAWVVLIASTRASEIPLRVPNGFSIERVSPREVQFPMFATLDEQGRLFLAESSGLDLYDELQKLTRRCRIRVLEDMDGDGRYESSRIFVDQLVFPMGLAWRDGKLFVADPPDLVTFEDTDGDGRADKRTVLLTGFGHSDNGSLHGLTFGPDGLLYLTMGQPDGYKLKRAGGTFVEGKSGALLRCEPDGSGVEVLARGFENLVEVVFLPGGEILGTDNWFTLPADGVRDALVHLVDGGRYPLNAHPATDRQQFYTGRLLPAVASFPAVAHSGLIRYRSRTFPDALHDNLFSAQFNTRKIVRHQLQESGSTFSSTDEDFVTTGDPDFHPADVLEDADGSLLIVDTGSWYVHHCPTGRIRPAPAVGGIYRVRSLLSPALKDPRGSELEWTNATATMLARRLGDDRVAVRDRAGNSLMDKGEEARRVLAQLLRLEPRESWIEPALWTLARLQRDQSRRPPRDALFSVATELAADHRANVRALLGRMLGSTADRRAQPALLILLRDPSERVRLAAAEALGRCGDASAAPALVQALTQPADPFLEHALIRALHLLGESSELRNALEHANPRVQRAALLVLDQRPGERLSARQVIDRLNTTDLSLRTTIIDLLRRHPEWLDEAGRAVAKLAVSPLGTPVENEGLAQLILAFQESAPVQITLAHSVTNVDLSAEHRAFLVEIISRSTLPELPMLWTGSLVQVFSSGEPALQLQVARIGRNRQLLPILAQLHGLVDRDDAPRDLRIEAIRAEIGTRPMGSRRTFDFLFSLLNRTNAPPIRILTTELLGRLLCPDPARDPETLVSLIRGDSLISPGTVLPLLLQAKGMASGPIFSYLRDAVETGWQPSRDEWRSMEEKLARQADVKDLFNRVKQREARRSAEIETYGALLSGGDPNRGHKLFLDKASCASCHRIGKQGNDVGPDLTKIGAIRSSRDLIESLAAPSASLAQGYETYRVVLKSGESLLGIQKRQPDDSFVLQEASGTKTRLRPNEIDTMERLPGSLMPDGILSALTRDDVRDLLAFLQSLK